MKNTSVSTDKGVYSLIGAYLSPQLPFYQPIYWLEKTDISFSRDHLSPRLRITKPAVFSVPVDLRGFLLLDLLSNLRSSRFPL